jgi:hypothetical protein
MMVQAGSACYSMRQAAAHQGLGLFRPTWVRVGMVFFGMLCVTYHVLLTGGNRTCASSGWCQQPSELKLQLRYVC